MNETINLKKVQVVNTTSLTDEVLANQEKQLVKITGTLTSRIEVKPSTDIPAYGFFKLTDWKKDIPVVFRIKDNQENWTKPKIPKGSNCLLEGEWEHPWTSNRPSFTCYNYQILAEPKALNITELITLASGLLTTSLEKKKEWTTRTDFLFKKLDELKEIDTLTKFGSQYLKAYLTLKKAFYANYQEKHLKSDFDLPHYLSTISQEIQLVKAHIEAYQSKQNSYEK